LNEIPQKHIKLNIHNQEAEQIKQCHLVQTMKQTRQLIN